MSKIDTSSRHSELLLGEIETEIVGLQYHEATATAGQRVYLEREPGNLHDPCAIRVENERFEQVGYLPRQQVSFLSKLIDDGKIRLDGHVPRGAKGDQTSLPVTLSVYLTEQGRVIVAKREVRSKVDGLHEMIRRTFEEIQRYSSGEVIREMLAGLKPLESQDLLPESRLLLAILPSIAHEVDVALQFRSIGRMQRMIDSLIVGEPQNLGDLSIFPIQWSDRTESSEPLFSLLQTAISKELALVEEVNEDGSVPNLFVTNSGDLPILIPEGEILIGAKQNRMVNLSVLVAAKEQFTLPVSCVEQGRWNYHSRHFESRYTAPAPIRSKNHRNVQRSRSAGDGPRSDQGEVWEDVEECLRSQNIDSPTSSLTDGYDAAEDRLRQSRQGLQLPDNAAGLLFARRSRIIGMDLFDSPSTFSQLKERILDAYLLASSQDGHESHETDIEVARAFLGKLPSCITASRPALGLGEELEISGCGVVGSVLLLEKQLCHLAAFAESP